MAIVLLTIDQLIIMAIYLIMGFALLRLGVISTAGSRDFAGLLVKVIIPAVIVQSFCTDFSWHRLQELVQSTLAAVLLLGASILLAHLIYQKAPLENFSAAFSNAGFMGIPLVRAVLGAEAVFYIVPFVALLNLLQWTYGVDVICRNTTKQTPWQLCRKLLWNPPMVAIGVGFVIFVSGFGSSLPSVLSTTLQGVCSLNAPLAMMILGVYLANEKITMLFRLPALYGVCAVRLILIPLVSLAIVCCLPLPHEIGQAVLLCAAAPVGANVAVYAQLYGRDHTHASKMVVLSTILSLLTLPSVAALTQYFL